MSNTVGPRPAPPARTARQPTVTATAREVVAVLRRHLPAAGTPVLDLHTGLDLAAALPDCRVFRPPAGPPLPYLDATVDVVVAPATDPAALAEARRVASHLALSVSASGTQVLWSRTIPQPAPAAPAVPFALPATVGRILICAPRLPEYDRQSGSRRTFEFLRILTDAGARVTFLAEDARGQEPYAAVLRRRGVAVYGIDDDAWPALAGTDPFDLAIVAFWHTAERILPVLRSLSPQTRVLVDTLDLDFLRRERQARVDPAGDDAPRRRVDRERELAAYAAADAVLTVSEAEARTLRATVDRCPPVVVVPDGDDIAAGPLGFTGRRGIVFLANFWHPPNLDALEYFAGTIAPRVDPGLLAEHPLVVVGNGADAAVRTTVARVPHARLVGWVPSVVPYLHAARVSVLPLRFGAGTKRKLIQALLAGTPSVSTSVGAEGLPVRAGEHLLVSDEPAGFAAALTRLLTDAPLWQQVRQSGRHAVMAAHSRTAVAQGLSAAIHAARRPARAAPRPATGSGTRRVLVVGTTLATQPNNAEAIAAELSASHRYAVDQRWASIGQPPRGIPRGYVAVTVTGMVPKFHLIDRVLCGLRVADYEYLLLCDDDVGLPAGFLDRFLDVQSELRFSLGQPARTETSYIDHPIVQRQPGVMARRTLFVESGPVVSMHRTAMPYLLPFPTESPMGWGLEEVWSHRIEAAGLAMGIVDATPVEHLIRPPTTHYRWEDAERGRALLHARQPHRPLERCLRVLELVAAP